MTDLEAAKAFLKQHGPIVYHGGELLRYEDNRNMWWSYGQTTSQYSAVAILEKWLREQVRNKLASTGFQESFTYLQALIAAYEQRNTDNKESTDE